MTMHFSRGETAWPCVDFKASHCETEHGDRNGQKDKVVVHGDTENACQEDLVRQGCKREEEQARVSLLCH
jgi:hypothetical protein